MIVTPGIRLSRAQKRQDVDMTEGSILRHVVPAVADPLLYSQLRQSDSHRCPPRSWKCPGTPDDHPLYLCWLSPTVPADYVSGI